MDKSIIEMYKSDKEKAERDIAKILGELNNKYGFESLNVEVYKTDVSTAAGKREYIYNFIIKAEI